jgi:hypothetical protein
MSNERAEFVAGVRLHACGATTRRQAEEGSRSEAKGAEAPARRLRENVK